MRRLLSRDDDNEMATDNAISALGKIVQFQTAAVDTKPLAATWLQALPVKVGACSCF